MLTGLLSTLLARWGISEAETWARRLTPVLIGVLVVALLAGAYAMIRHGGEQAGAAKEQVKVEKAHTAAVAQARADEHAAQTVSNRIAASTARSDEMTTTYVRSTIEDMHHAYDAVPPAAPAAVPPAAPVDSLRDSINAAIARANRAAATGPAAGGNGGDGNDQAADR